MRVQVLPLWPGISVVLVNEDERWRFSSWGTYEQNLPLPPDEDCAKWFGTPSEAVAHFKALCPRGEDDGNVI